MNPSPSPSSGAAKRVALLCTKLQHMTPSFLFSSYILFKRGNLVTRDFLGGWFVCFAGDSRIKTLFFFSFFFPCKGGTGGFPISRGSLRGWCLGGLKVQRQRSSRMGWACSGCHHAPSPSEISSQRMARCSPSPKSPPEPLRVRVRPAGTSDMLGSEGRNPVRRVGGDQLDKVPKLEEMAHGEHFHTYIFLKIWLFPQLPALPVPVRCYSIARKFSLITFLIDVFLCFR